MNNKTILSWVTFIFLILDSLPTQAQITIDGSTNTTVTPDNSGVTIEGGAAAESNLFHSFKDFSVPPGTEAFFNNGNNIENIFSRVTGGKLSNIEGLIRANGSANLFLINPAGILFGENARLDIGGSFYGSTAGSILFPGGIEFSANSQQAPVLTINAPIGLRFRDNPQAITNRSRSQNNTGEELVGLEVGVGKTLALVGGDINFESGIVTAKGGTVTLRALASAGEVSIAENNNLSLPQEVARGDINLENGAEINVQATGGGNVSIDARQLKLEAGELGKSEIKAGVISGSNTSPVQAGNVIIVAESISINESSIKNRVEEGAIGNAGNININANTIELDDANITTEVDDGGQGNGGDIIIKSQVFLAKNETSIETDVEDESLGGEAGNLLITADTIELDDSQIDTELETGIGRGGDISLEATNNIILKNGASLNAKTEGQGNAGDIDITANTVELDDANITAEVGDGGQGNGGTVTIKSQSFVAKNGTRIEGDIEDESLGGNGGKILITANTIELDNSQIDTEVEIGATGNGGDVSLKANNITLKNNAAIESKLEGEGNAGDIEIIADTIEFDNSKINTEVQTGAIGETGKINIEANNIILKNDASIVSKTAGQGDGGDINITARTIELNDSIITSEVDDEATGSGGNIDLTVSDTIRLLNNSLISTQAIEDGNGGNINIDAGLIIAFPSNGNGNDIIANAQRGNGGNITIITEALLGLAEGVAQPGNGTNDIDASSQFGLNGNVTFIIPDANNLEETAELAFNLVEDIVKSSNACSASSKPSRLVVQGKGGIPSIPGVDLNTEILLSDGKPIGLNLSQNNNLQETSNLTAGVQSVKTSVGDIYPARGVIVQEDGKVILTAYPVNQSHSRIPDNLVGCDSIPDTSM